MSSTDLDLESNIPFSGLLSLVKSDLIFFEYSSCPPSSAVFQFILAISSSSLFFLPIFA